MNTRFIAPLALAASVLGWGLSPIFIRYLSGSFDAYTLTFIRYGVSALVLALLSAWFFPRGLAQTRQEWPGLLQLAAINVVMQTLWTIACYETTATTAQLITKSETLFVIILSYIVFHEERRVIHHPLFLTCAALSMLGVIGIMIPDPRMSLIPTVDTAFFMLLSVSILWSFYAVRGKQIAQRMHPIPMFTMAAVFSTAGFGMLTLALGEPGALTGAPPRDLLLAAASGLLPIAVAHCAYHFAQLHLGAAFCITMMLCNPLFTHLIALALWDDEAMSWTQWTGASMLVIGSIGVIQAQRIASALTPAQDP
ncbi:MAG: DMT family transporter [Candidatus Hydrogenedentes bacterium]|nr:DMT family transporter [Candidatus Hydrogenedentota bacterium]